MREIRYRAWDKISETMGVWDDESKMVLFTQELDNGEYIIHKVSLDILIGNPNYELMQYTGLKDKNGKEIYEGDILESEAFIDTFDWMDGCYSFKRDMESLPITEHYPYEVIGNIYENPYLLINQSK